MWRDNNLDVVDAELQKKADIKTAEQYIVDRVKMLDVELKMAESRECARQWQADEKEKLIDKKNEEINSLKKEINEKYNKINDLLDYKNGLIELVKRFGWKTKKKDDKKGTKYYIFGKDKKLIEVNWDIFFAVNMVNVKK